VGAVEGRSIAEATDGRSEPGDDALRTQLHGMWAAVAPGWAEHAAYIDERSAELTDRLLALAAPAPGERVLELACGPGGLGLAAARRVAPGGEVVLSDVVAEMASIAAQRAAALGLDNVTTRVLDIEQIDEPDGSYDVVLCREGLMFATDHARAAREIHRVLRPGGRLALAVWGPRERNPWVGLVLDAVSAQVGAPVPPPGIPGPFSLEDSGRLAAILTEAGLADVAVEQLAVPMRAASFEEWWARTSALAGPLAKILEALPEPAVAGIRARVREAIEPYAGGGGLELPGLTHVASGRRP
jgi:ubiquinone/menaquinone biosynthesis C-methylase UbiE